MDQRLHPAGVVVPKITMNRQPPETALLGPAQHIAMFGFIIL